MDHRSTLIRNVEIPSTLPSMDTLTKLNGSILLKEVTSEEDGIRIEGDLLWRGYFEEGGGDCLWEGAEYFTETIPQSTLRKADPPVIEPKILSLEGEALSENTFRLTFDIRWFEEEKAPATTEMEKAPAKIGFKVEEQRKASATKELHELPKTAEAADAPPESATFPKTLKETPERPECREAEKTEQHTPKEPQVRKEEPKAKETSAETAEKAHCGCCSSEKHGAQTRDDADDFSEKLEAIDETWRETLKSINEPPEVEEKSTPTEETAEREEESEEVEIKCCPYSKFCLRYYRTQDGDNLEQIAEKFSATVAKLKEFNRMEESTVSSGRLLRIP